MLLSESKKLWKSYGLNSVKELRNLNISDLIVDYGNSDYGLLAAYKDYCSGAFSKTKAPLEVIWILEENKFLLIDGYHRLVEGILKNKIKYDCLIDWKGFTLLWKIPLLEERYKHNKHILKKAE